MRPHLIVNLTIALSQCYLKNLQEYSFFINITGEIFIVWALERQGDPEGLKNISPSLGPGSPHRVMNKAADFFLS